MIRILITPPFTQPIAPHYLDRESELQPIFDEYDIKIIDSADAADFEICGYLGGHDTRAYHLPKNRVILIDGEPPQPEYFLPYYRESGFAAILSPMNGKVYAPDGCAYYTPPTDRRPGIRKINKVAQLSTFRSVPGNWRNGTHMAVRVNGGVVTEARVLCILRCRVGLAIKACRPELIDIYGRGWPPEAMTIEDSRAGGDWYERKAAILSNYGFDLAWENMEVPRYVTEKFWQPIRSGVLPLYWGPLEAYTMAPPGTIIDCRSYESNGRFAFRRLIQDIDEMSEEEYVRRITALYDWYESLPRDINRRSLKQAAHILAQEIVRVADS